MATYKEIKGVTVQTVDSDPVVFAGSWSSGGSLNTGKGSTLGTATGSSNAFVAGGYTAGSPNRTTTTESYNGTSWTEVADIPTAYNYGNGFGTNTASVFAGTDPSSATTYVWNGSAWATPGNNLNTARHVGGTSGTSTAGAIFGGAEPSDSAKQEHWDGTSWTETTDMNTGKKNCFSGTGIQTAAMCIGYPNSPFTAEVWNGSSWTEIAELNTARGTGSGAGTTTAALFSGGQAPGYRANTEQYNGTSWTELSDLSLARGYIGNGGSGSSTATTDAIVYGGLTTVGVTNTEEWAFPPPTASTLTEGDIFLSGGTTLKGFGKAAGIPAATWSSGGAVNTARSRFGGATNATQTAGLIFGSGSSPYGQTEEYNGTAWSEQNDLNTGRYIMYGGGGTQTACITAGGYNPAGSPVYATTNAETYNGTSWTEVNDLNEGRLDCATFGTSTSAILVGGGEGPGGPGTVSSVESWDGTSWTETTNIPATRQEMGAWGSTSTAGAIVGGTQDTSPTITAETLEWDGTSWTAGGDYPSVLKYTSVFGSLNSAIVAGGENATAIIGICAHYNGTSWTEVAEMTTARMGCSGNGSAVSGFAASGGTSPGAQTNTEEFTADLTLADVTVS